MQKFLSMDESQRKQIIQFAAYAAAAGPVLLVLGKITKGVGTVSASFGKFATEVGKAGGGWKGFLSVLGKSPAVWFAVAAAVIAGTVALADYVSGAKQAREALQGMEDTAKQWKDTAAETFYENSEGLSFFGLSEGDFVRDQQSAQDWLDGLLAVWSDGEKESNEIVAHWTDSFKTLTASTRDELTALKETADKNGYTSVSKGLAADIQTLDQMDAEIGRLLKKRQNGFFSEKDQIRLQELIDTRETIEVKYHLTPEETGGFETIAQKVEAEVARAQARGKTDADTSVYENAVKAAAEGMAAINAQIDERYDKWTLLSEGCILRAPVPAAMTPSVDLVTQQYQTSTYDVQIYKITTKSGPLHLRSGTGTNYKILGKYKKGREVIVLNKITSSWYEVTAPDGKHGYMASQYLTFQRTETQTVQTNVGFRNQVIEARQLRDQPFRIYRVVPELDKVTVYARHIFYDLLDNMIKSLKPSPSAVGASVVQSLSGACLSAHDFSFYSDLTSTAEDVEWENVNPVEAMLGENGLVNKYGAELARDWYDVFLVRRVGNDTDVSIREKKNLTGISYDVDETDVVTRIMPTGEDADGNILYLPELYLDSPNLNAYTHPKWIHLPVSEAREVTDSDEPKSKTQCYAEMRKAAQAEFDAGCDLPTVTMKVDFVNCSDAEEYKQYAALTDIFLGDSVRVVARRIGVEVSMRMTQYTYDCFSLIAFMRTPCIWWMCGSAKQHTQKLRS